MPGEMQPSSKSAAPDPADSYERAHPEREAGQGAMDTDPKAKPSKQPDQMHHHAVKNKQDGARQSNGEDLINQRGGPVSGQPDHSMHDEEPMGSDQAPTDIHDPKQKRHPRIGGKGGTPDANESPRRS